MSAPTARSGHLCLLHKWEADDEDHNKEQAPPLELHGLFGLRPLQDAGAGRMQALTVGSGRGRNEQTHQPVAPTSPVVDLLRASMRLASRR